MLNQFKEVYDKRWKSSLGTVDDDILALGNPKRQVEFFYHQYNIIISKILKETIGGKDKKLLEIGCGRATSSIFQALKLGVKVFPTDYSEDALKIARKNLKKYGVVAKVSQEDLYQISYPDQSFDAIISLGVMEHIEKSEVAYKEMFRLLRSEGVMISMNVPEHPQNIQRIAVPVNKILVKIEKKIKKKQSKTWLDQETRSKTSDVYRSELYGNEFSEIVRKAGFQDVDFIEVNPFPTFDPLPEFLDRSVVNIYQFILHLRKIFLRMNYPFSSTPKNSRAHFIIAQKK